MVPLSAAVGGNAGCPKEAYRYLTDLKRGLLSFAIETLNSPKGKRKPDDCGDLMLEILKKAGLPDEKTGEVIPFGAIQKMSFGQYDQFPDLLVFHTAFTMICGMDECLYLFQKSGGKWKLILAHEAMHGENPTQENLIYLVFVPERKPTLVVAHTPLGCQSCWFPLSLFVLQAGTDPFKPKVLFTDEREASRCTEDMEFEKTDQGFSLTYTGQGSEAGFFRKVTEKYSLTATEVKRIEVKKINE
jgi:hypothetical protein